MINIALTDKRTGHRSAAQSVTKKSTTDGALYAVPSLTATVRQRTAAHANSSSNLLQEIYASSQSQSTNKSLISWLKMGKNRSQHHQQQQQQQRQRQQLQRSVYQEPESALASGDIYRRLPCETRAHYLAQVTRTVGRSSRLPAAIGNHCSGGESSDGRGGRGDNYSTGCEFSSTHANHHYGTVAARHGALHPSAVGAGTAHYSSHQHHYRRPSVHAVFDTGEMRRAPPAAEPLLHTQWPAVYMAAPMMTVKPGATSGVSGCTCRRSLMDTVRGRKKLCKFCSESQLALQQGRTMSRPNLSVVDNELERFGVGDSGLYAWQRSHRMASSETDLYGRIDEINMDPSANGSKTDRNKHHYSSAMLFNKSSQNRSDSYVTSAIDEPIYQRTRTKPSVYQLFGSRTEAADNHYRSRKEMSRQRVVPVQVPCPVTPDVIPRPKLMTTFLPDPNKAQSQTSTSRIQTHREVQTDSPSNIVPLSDEEDFSEDEWSDSDDDKTIVTRTNHTANSSSSSLTTCVGVPGSRLARLSLAGSSNQAKLDSNCKSMGHIKSSSNNSEQSSLNGSPAQMSKSTSNSRTKSALTPSINPPPIPPPPPPPPPPPAIPKPIKDSNVKPTKVSNENHTPMKPPRKKKMSSECANNSNVDSKSSGSAGLPMISVKDILNVKSILKKTSCTDLGSDNVLAGETDQPSNRLQRLKKVHFRSNDSLREDTEQKVQLSPIEIDNSDIIAALNDVFDRFTNRNNPADNALHVKNDRESAGHNVDSSALNGTSQSSSDSSQRDSEDGPRNIDGATEGECDTETNNEVTVESVANSDQTSESSPTEESGTCDDETVHQQENLADSADVDSNSGVRALASDTENSDGSHRHGSPVQVAVSGHKVAIEIGENGTWYNRNVSICTVSDSDTDRPCSSLSTEVPSKTLKFNDTMRIHMAAPRASVQNLFESPAVAAKSANVRVGKSSSFRSLSVRPNNPPPPPPTLCQSGNSVDAEPPSSQSTNSSKLPRSNAVVSNITSPSSSALTSSNLAKQRFASPISSTKSQSHGQSLKKASSIANFLPLELHSAKNDTGKGTTVEVTQKLTEDKKAESSTSISDDVILRANSCSSFRSLLENKLDQRFCLTSFTSESAVSSSKQSGGITSKKNLIVAPTSKVKSSLLRPVAPPQVPKTDSAQSHIPPLNPEDNRGLCTKTALQSDNVAPSSLPNDPSSASTSEDWSQSVLALLNSTSRTVVDETGDDSHSTANDIAIDDIPPPLPTSSPPPLPTSSPPPLSSTPESGEPVDYAAQAVPPETRLQVVIDSINAEENRSVARRRLERSSLAALGDLLENRHLLSSNRSTDRWSSPMLQLRTANNCDAASFSGNVASLSDHIYEEIPDHLARTRLQILLQSTTNYSQSMFCGASRSQILDFLNIARERTIGPTSEQQEGSGSIALRCGPHLSSGSDASDDSLQYLANKVFRTTVCDVERTDSGVGSESSCGSSSCSRSDRQLASCSCHDCADCDQLVEAQLSDSGELPVAAPSCARCAKKRQERRDIITELTETELKYGRDLRVVLEEFHRPMLVAGLLSHEQLSQIFLNVEELLEISQQLTARLRDVLERALATGDDDLSTVSVGQVLLENLNGMLRAFETYCTKQSSASALLASLEKDRELVRVFLKVSQLENPLLRRMNLSSFLMVPIQRVTKYPLLLSRLRHATPQSHDTYGALVTCQERIELHLEHMNAHTAAGGSTPSRIWRRISSIGNSTPLAGVAAIKRSVSELDINTLRLRKFGFELLNWPSDECHIAMEGRLLFLLPGDNMHWTRRGRNSTRMTSSHALLITRGQFDAGTSASTESRKCTTSSCDCVREAALVLIKDKATSNRISSVREPLMLNTCIVCTDADVEECFEVHDSVTKESIIVKADDPACSQLWLECLQTHMKQLGGWRQRRNALANIMIDINDC